MSTHALCSSKIRNIMYTPVNPTFSYIKWGLPGFSLDGLADVMYQITVIVTNTVKFLY